MSARDVISSNADLVDACRKHASAMSPLVTAIGIMRDLEAAGYRILAPGELDSREDDVAAAMWKAEAEDSGAPASIPAGRTREAFDDQSEELKARWRKFARAAIGNLKGDA